MSSQKHERDLTASHRDLVSRAKAASLAKNYDYTINLLQTVLKAEPLYLEGRQELRHAEILKYQSLSTFARQMNSVKVSAAAMKLSSKKSPEEELILAEEVLAMDPFNQKANMVVAEAATNMGLPEMKAFAYETICKGAKPNDKSAIPSLHNLAKVYMEIHEPGKAEKTYDKILEIDPRDGDALSGLKNASAANASRKGGWDDAGKDPNTDVSKGWRSVLKNQDQAEQLEQEGKVVKSRPAMEAQIQRLYEKHQAEPQNLINPKKIAEIYAQLDEFFPGESETDLSQAIEWYNYAFQLGGSTDSSIKKTISDLEMRRIERDVHTITQQLSQESDPELRAQLEAGLAEKVHFQNSLRLTQAEEQVKRHPNDGELRFYLGEAYFKLNQYKQALPEFQQSLKQPNVRYRAMNLMGQSYLALNMKDMAVDTFSSAASELGAMDGLKMEIMYNLGLAYDAMGKPDKGLEQFKEIYKWDMSYRDVAERVERSYGA